MEFRQALRDKYNQWIYFERTKYLNINRKQYQRLYIFY